MESQKEITIYDIANKLKLSASTVSRALQDHPAINKKTKKKIFDTAEQMGYRSNLFARNLRQQKTMTIGVMVHELNSSFMTSLLSGIEKVANEAGYGVVIVDSLDDVEKEAANARNLFNRRVDGVITWLSSRSNDLDHFTVFVDKSIPVVLIDSLQQHAGITSVVIDNRMCGYMAAKHLVEQGCRRIAHVTSGLKIPVNALRYKGFRDALAEHKIAFNERLVVVAPVTEEDSMEAARKIMQMKPMPDGVFVNNDFAAAVCIRTFLENKVKVPQELAVVGFNNDAIGTFIRPALTTINYPGKEMGAAAARTLINQLNGVGTIEQASNLTLRTELIVRQSSIKKR
jgi:LacI family transcriptional regulator